MDIINIYEILRHSFGLRARRPFWDAFVAAGMYIVYSIDRDRTKINCKIFANKFKIGKIKIITILTKISK